MHPAVHAAPQQSRGLEHPQVLRNRGQRHAERFGQLAYGRSLARQLLQNRAARGMRERGEHRIEPGVRIVNHVVNIQGGPGTRKGFLDVPAARIDA